MIKVLPRSHQLTYSPLELALELFEVRYGEQIKLYPCLYIAFHRALVALTVWGFCAKVSFSKNLSAS